MQLHEIKPTNPTRKKKRVGRGGKRGTTSGHGQKGQKSRAGRSIKPNVREMLLRFPKLRGVNFKPIKSPAHVISLDTLEGVVHNGDVITSTWLMKKKIIERRGNKFPTLKILAGKNKFTKSIILKGISVSGSAAQQIKESGGAIEE